MTQVVAANETLLFHNRLTHSLKVSQIARRMAEHLHASCGPQLEAGDGIDPDAAEAAALAHDLGHPPFGHVAEYKLRDLTEDIGGYEGNAQTFRIVTKLSIRGDIPGLNLTRATLRGILKYPWTRNADRMEGKKWGAYPSERQDFAFAIDSDADEGGKSLEAQVMDWADDITYAVHDLEDFYRARLTPLERLRDSEHERSRFIGRASQALARYEEFDSDLANDRFRATMEAIGIDRPYDGSNDVRRKIHYAGSWLITRFISQTRVRLDGNNLDIPASIWHEVNMLKQLTWQYVINSPDLASAQEGQTRIIEDMFVFLTDWVGRERSPDRLPARLREILKAIRADDESCQVLESDEMKIKRAVADYISSLTEAQAFELHDRVHGLSRSSALHGWVRA